MDDQQKDPSNWKLGIFYFNRNDKRIFVPKRFPILGFTINFANPYSVLVMVGLILMVVIAAAATGA